MKTKKIRRGERTNGSYIGESDSAYTTATNFTVLMLRTIFTIQRYHFLDERNKKRGRKKKCKHFYRFLRTKMCLIK